ncbi:nitric oxide reductase activation protein NorD [Niveibacterium microcysteis]|uniref:VWA domain-containing protein n=1 Tax=Niveibacterium microcysteis TaxID=2811415 RepID=A0ABX7M6K5_9RHOO|nr:VWA domain-containing protein [Niveibacterium microcysteis]QSI75047.1 VWA domain-containing protein [Niveibacterium microcysteis]
MAEAEDVIVDAARHATVYAQALLKRRRAAVTGTEHAATLLELAPRLDLLLSAVHGRAWPLRVARAPIPVSALKRLFSREKGPYQLDTVPSADAHAIWLPRTLAGVSSVDAPVLYRAMALQQAQRVLLRREWADGMPAGGLARDFALVLEAVLADAALITKLPGLQRALAQLRAEVLRRRPSLERFPTARASLERWLRDRLMAPLERPPAAVSVETLALAAGQLAAEWPEDDPAALLKDWWTGDWPLDEPGSSDVPGKAAPKEEEGCAPVRSARLARRPTVRAAQPDDEDSKTGAWMIQTSQPHEHAEDPMGLQRPGDRDTDSAAEGHAGSVSELEQARLVRSAQRSNEVLLSDDAPTPTAYAGPPQAFAAGGGIRYPEWDYRLQAYRDPGATVWESEAQAGSAEWVARCLKAQANLLAAVRQRFEMLRAARVVLRKQADGDEPDLDACIEAYADRRAGVGVAQAFYRTSRIAQRDCAVLVLVDVSGSTDSWVAGQRRIVDVEREALLVLSVALDGSGDPYAILAFSGHGPQQVTVRTVKRFDERHGDPVARRIAGLEPEHYTRAGAALRHASRLLAQQPARHQLLVLLSDGKPNDCDDYEGRYGVEDMRQAVQEIRRAGQSAFCLTVDRHAAAYLPHIFGPHQYALLQDADRLPNALLDWMRRLLVH